MEMSKIKVTWEFRRPTKQELSLQTKTLKDWKGEPKQPMFYHKVYLPKDVILTTKEEVLEYWEKLWIMMNQEHQD